MKRKIILLPALLITLSLGFSACQKDSSDNPATGNSSLGIKLQALNKNVTLPGAKSSSTTSILVWDTARMIVSQVKFEAEMKQANTSHDSIEIEFKWNGPMEINLLDINVTLGNFTLLPGFYDEIELKVEGLKKDAGNKPVFYLSGVYSKTDGTLVPIVFTVNENVVFKTEKNNVEVTPDISVFTSTILLYLDELLLDVQISDLENAALTNGVIVISDNSNSDLYDIIMHNLYKDHHSEHGHHHGQGH